MRKIYTRKGDEGTTALRGGIRVSKDDIRIEANGDLDELNAVLGVVRFHWTGTDLGQMFLGRVQQELLVVMSHVATPPGSSNPKQLHVHELTIQMENLMDEILERYGAPSGFVVPYGSSSVVHLHLARTIARRAERHLWTVHRTHPLPEVILGFVNRLSDLLFLMAWEAKHDSLGE